MTDLIERHNRSIKDIAKHGLVIVAFVLIGGVLVTWSWNTIVPGLIAGPTLMYKHALAIIGLGWVAGFLLRGRR